MDVDCFFCLLADVKRITPQAVLHSFQGRVVPLFVRDRRDVEYFGFLSRQLTLCHCCRTLLFCAERDHFFTVWIVER